MNAAEGPRHEAEREPAPGCGRGRTRRATRGGVVLALLAALAAVLTPAGSANPPSSGIKEYSLCLSPGALTSSGLPGTCDTSSLPGGSTVPLTLTVTNEPTSSQSLGSVNVDAPVDSSGAVLLPMTDPQYVDGTGTGAQTFDTNSSGELQLRNLNLPPGGSVSVTFDVTTPCAGSDMQWQSTAKQSNQYKGNGNDFQTPNPLPVSGIAADGCNLAWAVEPTSAATDSLITGSPFDPSGGSVGHVAVAAVPGTCTAVDPGNGCPVVTSAGGTVTLTQSGGTTIAGGTDGGFTGTTATMQNGVATFDGATPANTLQGANEGTGYTLVASASGFNDSVDSSSFLLGSGVACSGTGCPSFTTSFTDGTTVQSSATGANFGFLAVLQGPGDYPSAVTAPGGGCAYWQPLGATGFEAYDGGSGPDGILYFTYKIPWAQVVNSVNNGVSQEPICARAKPRDSSGRPVSCVGWSGTPWLSRILDPDGSFANGLTNAVCDASDGYFYGILPLSPQDHVPSSNPQVLDWTRVTGDGDYFSVSVGYPWDFGMRG